MREPNSPALPTLRTLVQFPSPAPIKPVDAVGFTGFHSRNWPIKYAVLDANSVFLNPIGRALLFLERGGALSEKQSKNKA